MLWHIVHVNVYDFRVVSGLFLAPPFCCFADQGPRRITPATSPHDLGFDPIVLDRSIRDVRLGQRLRETVVSGHE
jgi:hypothetical protein